MRGRRRSPPTLPPPPGGFRRDDRRYPTAPRERRRRSITPDRFRRGGSPPPYKRGRYGRDGDDFFPRGGYDQGPYGRPSPPRRDGPRPYKDFCRTLPDDVTPEQAQKDYQQYLSDYWGSAVRADFEAKKGEDWMRSRFDPRGIKKALQERNADAIASAKVFADDIKSGVLDPKSEDFNQGTLKFGGKGKADVKAGGEGADEAEKAEGSDEEKEGEEAKAEEVAIAPAVSWLANRISVDFSLSKKLIAKLDAEKGISGNDLLATEEEAAADVKEEKSESIKKEAAEAVKEEKVEGSQKADGKEANGTAEVKEDVKMEESAPADEEKTSVGGGKQSENGKVGSEPDLGKLDLQLTYLWRVHGIDYYTGKEFADPTQFKLRVETTRTIRGPRPEEGEKPSEAEERKSKKAAEAQIDKVWKKRITTGDPFEASLQQEKMDTLLNEWIEDQVKKIDENKWGCKLSQKLFVGRDYVLKHIKLKHTEKVEDQKSKIYEDIFWQNYKKFREEEQKMMEAEVAKMQQAMAIQQTGTLPMPWDGSTPAAGRGQPALPVVPSGPIPAFAGTAGMMMGLGAPPPIMHKSMGNTMLPGAMMPQPGQVLVLAPGAGPLGPFISVPISEAGGYGRIGVGPGRGAMPGRGMARGGRFNAPFHGAPPPRPPPRASGREYFDLDNPSNNRSVLDYGDL